MTSTAAAQNTCPAADPNDLAPDDQALMNCFRQGGTITLVDGDPGYIIYEGLVLQTSNVTITSSFGRPFIVAHEGLLRAMLRVGGRGHELRDFEPAL